MAASPMHDVVNTLTLTDNVSKVWNRHNLKVGIDLRGDQYLQEHHSGSASFVGKYDFGRNTNHPFDTNYAYSNALFGYFNNYSQGSARLDYKPRTKMVRVVCAGQLEGQQSPHARPGRAFHLGARPDAEDRDQLRPGAVQRVQCAAEVRSRHGLEGCPRGGRPRATARPIRKR
jgi:hypothetical protein